MTPVVPPTSGSSRSVPTLLAPTLSTPVSISHSSLLHSSTNLSGVSPVGVEEGNRGEGGEEEGTEEEGGVGAPGTGAVVDMEVFGQLLEIVSWLIIALSLEVDEETDRVGFYSTCPSFPLVLVVVPLVIKRDLLFVRSRLVPFTL